MSRLGWFEGYGIEIEYMIVDADSGSVRPIADRLLAEAAGGEVRSEVERGPVAWSNELALHVVEFKTNGPAPTLDGLETAFQADVVEANRMLAGEGARLLPGAMHPWMDPHTELELWPYGNNAIYQAYDRIFSCRGHGWSNLQSMQINLPFGNDEEFGRLHAALRLALPILPGLAASSPYADGHPTGLMDTRMEVYRGNSKRIPSVTGAVIPEPIFSESGYREGILETLYADIAPFDPDGLLQEEWLNSRGVIARFDRHAFEIRVIDSQECPLADMAVAHLTAALVRALGEEAWSDAESQRTFGTDRLASILSHCNHDAEAAEIDDTGFLRALGYTGASRCRTGQLWADLAERLAARTHFPTPIGRTLDQLLASGTLARRLATAVGPEAERGRLTDVYRALADCLAEGRLFHAG